MIRTLRASILLAGLSILAACGGGSDGGSPFVPAEPIPVTLTVNLTGQGAVSSQPAGIDCPSDCAQTYATGTSVTLSATPAAGQDFSGWSGSGVACATTGPCTVVLDASKSVTAIFSPKAAASFSLDVTLAGAGQVASDVAGLTCTALHCAGSFAAGTVVTLTATPATGNTFGGWSASGLACTGDTCRVTMGSNRLVTATFTPVTTATHPLTVQIAVPGTGSVGSSPAGIACGADCTESYPAGTVVRLGATPAAGYAFAGWSGEGCTGNGTCDVTLSAARSVTATFSAVPANGHALNTVIASGSGTVTSAPAGIDCPSTCAKTFAAGTAVTLTAVPAAGQRFTGWSGASCTGTGTCVVTMSAATTVGAQFAPIVRTLSVVKQGTGSGVVTSAPAGLSCGTVCAADYAAGSTVVLTAAPAAGSTFAGWGGACTATSGTCSVAMNASANVTATFTAVPTQVLTVTKTGSGSVASSPAGINCGSACSASFVQGDAVTLTAVPATGYVVGAWSGACSGSAATCNVTLNAAVAASVSFVPAGFGTPGPTFYVDASAPNDVGSGSAASPKKYITSGAALLPAAGGGTLIVKAGTYANAKDQLTSQGSGKAGAWNVIKAEVDGSVVITAGLDLPYADHYLQLEGLLFDDMRGKSILGRYVKVLRSGFKGGPLSDNTMNLSVGTNDVTPGAQFILIEDSYFYGPGGRYNLLVYNSDKVVLRRVVVRHDAGWSDIVKEGDPQAAVSLYNSTNVLTQNLVIVDSVATKGFESTLYHPSNERPSDNIRNVGTIILNNGGNGVCWDDHATVRGMTLENSVVANAAGVGVCTVGGDKAVSLKNVTVYAPASHGVANWGQGTMSVADSIITGQGGEQTKGTVTLTGLRTTAPKWLVRSDTAAGANILKRSGKSGTLYGEPGFDQDQAESLWPFPGEAQLKKSLCVAPDAHRGFCDKTSLTEYVWGALGTPTPATFTAP